MATQLLSDTRINLTSYLTTHTEQELDSFREVYFSLSKEERAQVDKICGQFCRRIPGIGTKAAINLFEALAQYMVTAPGMVRKAKGGER